MRNNFFGISFCLLIFTAGFVAAFSGGPPDGRTGAPGESNCTVGCHSSSPLNSGSGTLTITGPSTYEPHGSSIMTIVISQMGQSRWGFEATALDTNDNFVGFFMDIEAIDRVQISPGGAREYVKHAFVGTDAGTSNVSPGWQINWQAPTTNVGPVTIYVAANAADNNNSNTGDFIYTESFTITPIVSSCCVASRGNVDNDPNDNVDISDLVFIVDFIFTNGSGPVCPEEANVDGDVGENIDISDLVYIVDFIFTGGPQPPACP